jgi:hypothetical protein
VPGTEVGGGEGMRHGIIYLPYVPCLMFFFRRVALSRPRLAGLESRKSVRVVAIAVEEIPETHSHTIWPADTWSFLSTTVCVGAGSYQSRRSGEEAGVSSSSVRGDRHPGQRRLVIRPLLRLRGGCLSVEMVPFDVVEDRFGEIHGTLSIPDLGSDLGRGDVVQE